MPGLTVEVRPPLPGSPEVPVVGRHDPIDAAEHPQRHQIRENVAEQVRRFVAVVLGALQIRAGDLVGAQGQPHARRAVADDRGANRPVDIAADHQERQRDVEEPAEEGHQQDLHEHLVGPMETRDHARDARRIVGHGQRAVGAQEAAQHRTVGRRGHPLLDRIRQHHADVVQEPGGGDRHGIGGQRGRHRRGRAVRPLDDTGEDQRRGDRTRRAEGGHRHEGGDPRARRPEPGQHDPALHR
ncbi:hypothetical protein [Nocardia farcinica]|uniref:hypothetical protein n=1 Tax=Nocardia farcinica TaxID=37329 RepID=UPI0018946A05|nr:hypothetical protein [Nocardia farcinica]MBF6249716.1 hypothetical protein [Nocardia farcinica]